jgi:uncharacterized pyridoxamine 5'-phosphate oxidase family protein
MKQTALDFLRQHPEVCFATCENGRPRIRVFQIMRQAGTTLYFATSPQKAVYRQLLRNAAIEIMAVADRVSVRCAGKACFDVDDECQQWIYNNNPVLPRLYSDYRKLAYFSLPIEEICYYDLRPTPPVNVRIDLTAGTETSGFVGERFEKKPKQ